MSKSIDLKKFLPEASMWAWDVEGDLEEFMRVFDEPAQFGDEVAPISLSDIKDKITQFPELWDIDNIPEQYFNLLANKLNYLRSNRLSIDQERKLLKNLIYIYRRKGTIRSFKSIAVDLGIKMWVYNNLYKVLVPSEQGQLSGYRPDQQLIVTGRTRDLLPSIIYPHDGFLEDKEDISEGIIDLIFTFTPEYELLKDLVSQVAPAGFKIKYTERTQNYIEMLVTTSLTRMIAIFRDPVYRFTEFMPSVRTIGELSNIGCISGILEAALFFTTLDLDIFQLDGRIIDGFLVSDEILGILDSTNELSGKLSHYLHYLTYDLPVFTLCPEVYVDGFRGSIDDYPENNNVISGVEKISSTFECALNANQISLVEDRRSNLNLFDITMNNQQVPLYDDSDQYSWLAKSSIVNFG